MHACVYHREYVCALVCMHVFMTVEGVEKFIFLSFFVALGEKLLLIITNQGKYFFLDFEFV